MTQKIGFLIFKEFVIILYMQFSPKVWQIFFYLTLYTIICISFVKIKYISKKTQNQKPKVNLYFINGPLYSH